MNVSHLNHCLAALVFALGCTSAPAQNNERPDGVQSAGPQQTQIPQQSNTGDAQGLHTEPGPGDPQGLSIALQAKKITCEVCVIQQIQCEACNGLWFSQIGGEVGQMLDDDPENDAEAMKAILFVTQLEEPQVKTALDDSDKDKLVALELLCKQGTACIAERDCREKNRC